jgi:hypothetical protein
MIPDVIAARHAKRAAALAALFLLTAPPCARAHDAERTEVTLTFARDGSFVLDVANDANWLRLRLEDFAGDYPGLTPTPDTPLTDAQRDARLAAFASTFADRIVMWVDHAEVRPATTEYIPPRPGTGDRPVGTFRMRGRVPIAARKLQWFYGIVVDPYPMAIHLADRQVRTEAVLGNAWTEPIDLTGQFREPALFERVRVVVLRGAGWWVTLAAAMAMSLWIAWAGLKSRPT